MTRGETGGGRAAGGAARACDGRGAEGRRRRLPKVVLHLQRHDWRGAGRAAMIVAVRQRGLSTAGRPAHVKQRGETMAKDVHVSELESRKVAEASREAEWKQPSFLREMFLGNFRLDLIHPYPLPAEERPEFAAFYNAIKELLRDQVDVVEMDATGEYPEDVVDSLRKMGAFGM